MEQIKKFKRKVILLLGIIVCMFAIICCIQNAYADTQEGDSIGSVVTDEGLEYQFNSHEELNNLCKGVLSDKPTLTINFYKDLNFEKDYLEVPSNKKYNVNLNNHKLSNELIEDYFNPDKSFSIIDVKGSLNLYGQHGILEPKNNNPSINVNVGGTVHVNNIDFKHSYIKRNYCGGVYICGINKDQYFENCTFDCKGENAGVVYVGFEYEGYINSKITFLHCDFNNCQAENFGGVLYSAKKNLNLEFNSCSFANCSSGQVGGAIYLAEGNNAVIESCSVKNCSCTADHGGFIGSSHDNVNLTINNSNIDNCHAGDSGGAIYLASESGMATFNDTTISNCSSDKEGGAISTIRHHMTFKFKNTTISNCHSEDEGGAIYVKSSNSCFDGGLYSASNVGAQEYGLTIRDCQAHDDGGAVYFSNATGYGNEDTLKYIKFINNKTTEGHTKHNGAAICTYGNKTVVDNCYFEGNSSSDNGGAICKPNFSSYVYVNNCIFKDNSAEDYASEVYFKDNDNFAKCDNNTVYCSQGFNIEKAFNIDEPNLLKGHFNLVY